MNRNEKKFYVPIKKVKALLKQAASAENPALYLFQHDLRTPFFQLQGLARIYSATGPAKKKFKKLLEKFKELEDLLGAIDYYVAFTRAFEKSSKIPGPVKNYFSGKANEKIDALNKVLKHQGWLSFRQTDKIAEILREVDWKDPEEQYSRLKKFYSAEIRDIADFAENGKMVFTDVEEGIHEFRRKLRWLSIYAQALQGDIQLAADEKETPSLAKYLTAAIINAPYNQLPENKDPKQRPLYLSRQNFFALSWMIHQLGALKDKGLTLQALAEAVAASNKTAEADEAMAIAGKYLGKNYASVEKLLSTANRITAQFFRDGVLANLMK